MNFDYECNVSTSRESGIQRRMLVRISLDMCKFEYTENDVDEITERLAETFGHGPEADRWVLSHISREFLQKHFDRKRDERNRKAFQDELAARVWETVKGMTWYTDEQKDIPEDLAARVEQKRIDEAEHLEELRAQLTGKRYK